MKMIDPACIRSDFVTSYFLKLPFRTMWVRPTKKKADREHPAPVNRVIKLSSVIAWFEISPPDVDKFAIPQDVQTKLQKYAYCLFGSARSKGGTC